MHSVNVMHLPTARALSSRVHYSDDLACVKILKSSGQCYKYYVQCNNIFIAN